MSAPRNDSESGRTPSRRVLIVDDSADIRALLERLLTSHGYTVEIAGDGDNALDSIRRHPPDLVLLDIAMPGLSGLEVLRRMRRDGIRVPVIAISGHPVAEQHIGPSSLQLGAVEFVCKPLVLEEIERRVAAALARG